MNLSVAASTSDATNLVSVLPRSVNRRDNGHKIFYVHLKPSKIGQESR